MRLFSTFTYWVLFTFRSWSDPQLHLDPGAPEPADLLVIQDHHPPLSSLKLVTFFQNYFFATLSSSKLVILDSSQRRS